MDTSRPPPVPPRVEPTPLERTAVAAPASRRQLAALAAVAGLWGFAVAQPILALLGDNPAFFVVRDARPLAIVVAAVVIALVIPVLAWSLGLAVARVSPRAGEGVHLATIALLAAAAIAPLVRRSGFDSTVGCIAVGLAAAAVVTWAYARVRFVATWTRITAFLPVASLVIFLAFSPTSGLIVPRTPGTTSATGSGHPSVAFLLLDELPTQSLLDESGNIDALRYPNLARLNAGSTWYRNSTTVANGTIQAVPAMLSGRLPKNAEPTAAAHPDTLFSLLAPTHRLVASESFTALCGPLCDPPGDPTGTAEQISSIAGGATGLWRDRLTGTDEADLLAGYAEEVTTIGADGAFQELYAAPTRFTEFLDSVQPSDDPALWFLHLVLPHQPWRHYPDGSVYASTTVPSLDTGPWVASVQQQRHLYQARYTDFLVGELIDHLQAIGEYDDTVFVVASDHGVAFQPGRPERLWSPDTVSEVAYAPLFIKAPGQVSGATDDRNVMTVDIVPTVAALLGIDVPWTTAGAAVDDIAIERRGDAKWMYDFGPLATPNDGVRHEFELSSTRPSAAARWVGERRPDEPPLSALLRPLDVAPLLGASLDDIASDPGPQLATIDEVSRPTFGYEGFVRGRIANAADDALVLVAVDGTVVTASPVFELAGERGEFLAMLPPGLADATTLDRTEIAIVQGSEVVRAPAAREPS